MLREPLWSSAAHQLTVEDGVFDTMNELSVTFKLPSDAHRSLMVLWNSILGSVAPSDCAALWDRKSSHAEGH